MDSIRNAAKMVGVGAGIGAVGATAGSMYAGDNFRDSAERGMYAGLGGGLGILAGMAAPKIAGAARSLKIGAAAGLRTGSLDRFTEGVSRGMQKTGFGGMKASAIGAGAGALGGLGYAALNSNKPVNPNDYGARLKFEEKRKKMIVDENIRQMAEMRSLMGR